MSDNSKMRQLKETADYKAAWEKVYEWMGGVKEDQLLHVWEDFRTFYFIMIDIEGIYFLRVFKLGDRYVISEDKCQSLFNGRPEYFQ